MKKLLVNNLELLKDSLKGKKILCFGAGIQGIRAAMYIESWNLDDNFIGYIDNNKSGEIVEVLEKKYPIYSLEKVLELSHDNIIILVTCMDYKSVYKQLEFISDVDCKYIALDEVAEKQLFVSDYPQVIREKDVQMIPKKIHYAWLGNEMPESSRKNVEHWKELCPDYEFYEWNDKNYNVHANKYMEQAYERKMWGFVPDYMRLDIIYNYGGIYLDTDIEMIKKPDELLYQRCFGCVDATFTMNLGSGFGAVAKEKIIQELRDYYNDVSFIKEDGSIDNTSCNTHSYRVLRRYGVSINDKVQNVNGMNIYPMIFQGACQHTRAKKVTDKTFWVHYGNMSWFDNSMVDIKK